MPQRTAAAVTGNAVGVDFDGFERFAHSLLPMRLFLKFGRILAAISALVMLANCSPLTVPAGERVRAPAFEGDRYVAADGAVLPLSVWTSAGPAKAVILGIHGFGDYRTAFEEPAAIWANKGITTYAYDQRGFGAAPNRGYWAGTESLVEDIRVAVRLVRQRHPGVPIYLAGESMGGALALAASDGDLEVDGLILMATALRSRDTLGPLTRGGLEFFAFVLPWFPLGPTSIDFQPTDSPKTMEKLRNDKMILRNPRVDMGYGLVEAMDAAKEAAPRIAKPYLMLHGMGDKLVPQASVKSAIEVMPRRPDSHLAYYKDGYHMILRDKRGAVPTEDIAAWILGDKRAPLPSGADAEKSQPDIAGLWGSKRR
jgi:alpha-beta hydrolase superfamily lysophospholipase